MLFVFRFRLGACDERRGASAEPPAYRDGRSDPAALIESPHNALKRRECARAWDCFGAAKSAGSYASFVRGYTETEAVDLRLEVVSEGAAGRVFSQVPAAIRTSEASGAAQVFASCYMSCGR